MEGMIYYVRVRRRWKEGTRPYDCFTSYLVRADNQIEARMTVAKLFPGGFAGMQIRRGPLPTEQLVGLGEDCP